MAGYHTLSCLQVLQLVQDLQRLIVRHAFALSRAKAIHQSGRESLCTIADSRCCQALFHSIVSSEGVGHLVGMPARQQGQFNLFSTRLEGARLGFCLRLQMPCTFQQIAGCHRALRWDSMMIAIVVNATLHLN